MISIKTLLPHVLQNLCHDLSSPNVYAPSASGDVSSRKSFFCAYTTMYPLRVQIEQLQLLAGYLESGGDKAKRKRTAPQWQCPLC